MKKANKKSSVFCPKCKSEKIRIEITASAALGAPQQMICDNCGFMNHVFPKRNLNYYSQRL